MANKKITELTALTTPAVTDVLAIVDVAGAETKKITVANLTGSASILTQVVNVVDNAAVLTMKYDDTPITLVGKIAGKIIVPVGITIVATAAGTTETVNSDLRFGWDAGNSTTGDYFGSLRNAMKNIASPDVNAQSVAPFGSAWTTSYTATPVNLDLQAWSTAVFGGGWSMVIYTTYYTITV
jgi:hypothetical protein